MKYLSIFLIVLAITVVLTCLSFGEEPFLFYDQSNDSWTQEDTLGGGSRWKSNSGSTWTEEDIGFHKIKDLE